MNIQLAARRSKLWLESVGFVSERFAQSFGAQIDPNPDHFMVISSGSREAEKHDAAPRIEACAGFTFASDKPFFLERYLDAPIEELIAQRVGAPVDRRRIVEIGALAGGGNQAGLELLRAMPLVVWCQGMHYSVCTVTAPLLRTLKRLRIPFEPLAMAEPSRLHPEERPQWGTYYENEPRVGWVRIASLAPLFEECTGRYAFFKLDVTLFKDATAHAEVLAHAHG